MICHDAVLLVDFSSLRCITSLQCNHYWLVLNSIKLRQRYSFPNHRVTLIGMIKCWLLCTASWFFFHDGTILVTGWPTIRTCVRVCRKTLHRNPVYMFVMLHYCHVWCHSLYLLMVMLWSFWYLLTIHLVFLSFFFKSSDSASQVAMFSQLQI
jgi:hypothetical protein